ncbi:Cell division protein ZipA [Candidatus Providencia siddallii]|uniref:Cell division protein ZipA n=1 Tax=Candidatus Providencia siddallii TaxID=1715285 RepID=A0A0M6W956_9GAMM|nr:Cell division protein ZipA [Candidatus Providencia siddallii]
MQDLRFILIILSVIIIVILILHGLWINNKESSQLFHNNKFMNNIKNNKELVIAKDESMLNFNLKSSNKSEDLESSKIIIKNTDELLLNKCMNNNSNIVKTVIKIKNINDDLNNKSVDISEKKNNLIDDKRENLSTHKIKFSEKKSETNNKKTVLILNVAAHKGKVLQGNALLQSIIQIGFKFGDMKIFHRHVNPSGSGPVLFSLINMVKPGSFNLDDMFEFTTLGISTFMIIPCYGEAEQNFKLMLQATQCIASDTGGIVLDDERKILTPQKIKIYYNKIKSVLN